MKHLKKTKHNRIMNSIVEYIFPIKCVAICILLIFVFLLHLFYSCIAIWVYFFLYLILLYSVFMINSKNHIISLIIKEATLTLIIGVIVSLLTPIINDAYHKSNLYNERNKNLINMDIGISKQYSEQLFGNPMYYKSHTANANQIEECIYSTEGAVIRNYYMDDKIIGYFITITNNDSNNTIISPYFSEEILLGHSHFNNFCEEENNLESYATNGASHYFAMEHYFAGMESNYCELYYGVLDYGYMFEKNFVCSGENSLNDRSIAIPNTIGVSLSNYEEYISQYIRDYSEYNFTPLYKN